jgi:hypothetical protein
MTVPGLLQILVGDVGVVLQPDSDTTSGGGACHIFSGHFFQETLFSSQRHSSFRLALAMIATNGPIAA